MKLLTLIRYDLKNYFNSKLGFLMMLILPILAMVIAMQISTTLFVNHSFIDPITLLIVDKEESFYTNFFIQKIVEAPSLQHNMEFVKTTEEKALQLLDLNKAAGMVIIPANFTPNMQNGIYEPLRVMGNHNKPLQATIIKEGMESVTNLMSAAQSAVFTVCYYAREAQMSPEEIDRIFQKASLTFSLKALGRDQIFSQTIKTPWMDMAPAHFYFSSLLILFMSLYGLQGMYLYMSERQNKITTRIRTVGISLWQIILGKWLSLTLFLFTQGAIILGISSALRLFKITGDLTLGLLLLLLIASCISSFVLLISSFSKNDYMATMVIFIVSILGVFMGGGIVPYAYMPKFMAQLGQLTMNHWAVQGLIYSLFGNHRDLVWKSAGIILVLTIVSLSCLLLKLHWEAKKHATI